MMAIIVVILILFFRIGITLGSTATTRFGQRGGGGGINSGKDSNTSTKINKFSKHGNTLIHTAYMTGQERIIIRTGSTIAIQCRVGIGVGQGGGGGVGRCGGRSEGGGEECHVRGCGGRVKVVGGGGGGEVE